MDVKTVCGSRPLLSAGLGNDWLFGRWDRLDFYCFEIKVSEVELVLQVEPKLGGSVESLWKANGHFNAYRFVAIQNLVKMFAWYSKMGFRKIDLCYITGAIVFQYGTGVLWKTCFHGLWCSEINNCDLISNNIKMEFSQPIDCETISRPWSFKWLARHREIVDRSDGIENSEPQHQGGIFPIAGNEVSVVEFFQPAMFDGLDQKYFGS